METTSPHSQTGIFEIAPEVSLALRSGQPVVALESAVITHGLPHPHNLQLALVVEETIRQAGAVPATIALMGGKVWVGLTPAQVESLADPAQSARKVSRRDFGPVLASHQNGGTTVAATLFAAHRAGIQVFSTGGIGGVHRGAPYDVSADLAELSQRPVVTVCAGAKAILDLPATLEVLETMSVPVLGYRCDEFPAFYSTSSGLSLETRIETPAQAAQIARRQWDLGLSSSILVVQPPPAEYALPYDEVEGYIQSALRFAEQENIHGAAVTPYLLQKVADLSGGSSLQANIALLKQNATLAAQIAIELAPQKRSYLL